MREFGAYPFGEASYAQRLVEKRRDWGINTNQEIPVILRLIKILNEICCIATSLQIL